MDNIWCKWLSGHYLSFPMKKTNFCVSDYHAKSTTHTKSALQMQVESICCGPPAKPDTQQWEKALKVDWQEKTFEVKLQISEHI